jgi:hypothetical protein
MIENRWRRRRRLLRAECYIGEAIGGSGDARQSIPR